MGKEEQRIHNQQIFWDTKSILENGYYIKNGKQVPLKLSKKQMQACTVFLPDAVREIREKADISFPDSKARCAYGCFNIDSFEMAQKRMREGSHKSEKNILVLNLANPVNPGGGVLKGSKAQEEDLCRRSTLSASLFSEAAQEYYLYNRSLRTYMGSDAVIITPEVEIIKDPEGNLMDDSKIVAVLTCAAPMLTYGMEGLSDTGYMKMLYDRIDGMLKVAAYLGYRELVLGAFGCGAFGNDAEIVSDIFYQVFRDFDYNGLNASNGFSRVDFAVLSRDGYNYRQFLRNFDNFYREERDTEKAKREQRIRNREKYRDAIRGSLIGGAVGDALGYEVEFMKEDGIFQKFGENGIEQYVLNPVTRKAVISDDTQMTLFTANGLLCWETLARMRSIRVSPRSFIEQAYFDWLTTQEVSYAAFQKEDRDSIGVISWLMDVEELYHRRAPGITCLNALKDARKADEPVDDYIRAKRNDSKGCGGVMRVAPVALKLQPGMNLPIRKVAWESAQAAAITHGHSLGYMPAAVLSHILSRIVYMRENLSLKEIVLEARDCVRQLFERDPHIGTLTGLITHAVLLSENAEPDLENIHALGEGWVAEEALAIAIYCALRYQNDFSKAIIVSVNHDGDSDSTGAITGNILGAWIGYEAIEQKWKTDLECKDVILEIADDLCFGCQMRETQAYYDPAWAAKYIEGRRYEKPKQYTFFWKAEEQNGCFSNWYPSPFTLNGIAYQNVEQFMMAEKARVFGDELMERAILNAKSPADCKQLGRRVKGFDSVTWDRVKGDILRAGNLAKYTQNPALKQKLLETGESILAEASPKDRIWGIGLEADIAGSMEPEDWPGQNLLGTILMELRTELRA